MNRRSTRVFPDPLILVLAMVVALASQSVLEAQLVEASTDRYPQQEKSPEDEATEEEDASNEKDDKEKKKDKEKAFDEVVKEMEKIEGLFTFYREADENKVLIELSPEQLDKDFLYSSKIEQATGERGLYGTLMMDAFVFQWRRLGKRVQFVQKNTRFRAAANSPAARAVKNSFSDSVLASGKIEGKPHPERNSVLVNLHELFASRDLHGMGENLKKIYKTGYKFDKTDSGIVFLKSFPKNSEIGARVNFRAEETKRGSVTIPNTRILSLTFRYSLVALPQDDYLPRLADDRVGTS